MIYIRSLLFNISFFVWMFFVAFMASMGGIFGSRDKVYFFSEVGGHGIAFLLKYITGITHSVIGKNHLPKDGRYIIACKHQSTWETMLVNNIFHQTSMIYKKELLNIPIFGTAIKKAECIPVDRSQGKKAIDSIIIGGKKSIDQGRPIFIYPEGSRTGIEDKPHYKYGITALYKSLNVPVIPVALNSGYFWPRRSFLKKPGKIILKILPKIDIGLNEKKFGQILEESIEKAVKEISPRK